VFDDFDPTAAALVARNALFNLSHTGLVDVRCRNE
jgi:hypothetical protein